MDPILNLLSGLGLGLATNSIYDLLKAFANKQINSQRLPNEVQNQINLHGLTMSAETVINALVQNGYLSIENSHLYASKALIFGSQQGGAVVGNSSSLRTDRTAITMGAGAFMQSQGNAQVRQNADGTITFHIGVGK